jgi:mRNA interferase RelE/StbE
MPDYAITFARSARKELEALDVAIIHRIWPRIEALAQEPRPKGCRKLQGEKYLWRIRIGDYRVVYAVYDNDQHVDIVAVRHRSKAYEGL